MLPLGEAEAATNPQLDKHFSSISKLLQSTASYAGETHSLMNELTHVFEYCVVGWENGDSLWATYPESRVVCRHSTTNNDLVSYNTTTDSSGATVRDAVVANYGSFSSTVRPWYKAGRDCGRYNNSRYGKTCITAVYSDATTGDLMITLVQPFYDANYTFLGSHH